MMRAQYRSLLVAAIHLALVGLVGGKFLLDRATYPRVWAQAVPIDPDLPIRGRYVRLNAAVDYPAPGGAHSEWARVRLEARNHKLTGVDDADGKHHIRWERCGPTGNCWILDRPLAYFIPEHIPDPSRRAAGEQLWVEISIPPTGPPRPLRLGVKAGGAEVIPLQLR